MPTAIALPTETGTDTPIPLVALTKDSRSKDKPEFQNVFAAPRSAKTTASVHAVQELAHNKKVATAQATAKQRAQSTIAETQKQLKFSEAEITRMRDELKRAQNELLATKAEHTHQLRQAVDRESGLWDELVEVRGLAITAKERASGYRKKLLTVLLVLVLPAMVWAAVVYQPVVFAQSANGKSPDVPVATSSERPAPAVEVAKVPTRDFAESLDRLDQALGQFTQDRPEDVLRRVHDMNAARGVSVCSFEWANGQVSLVFGSKPGMGIEPSVANCADAVEQAAK